MLPQPAPNLEDGPHAQGYRWASLPPWSRLPRCALESEKKGVGQSLDTPVTVWAVAPLLGDGETPRSQKLGKTFLLIFVLKEDFSG